MAGGLTTYRQEKREDKRRQPAKEDMNCPIIVGCVVYWSCGAAVRIIMHDISCEGFTVLLQQLSWLHAISKR